jgi:uncharacterized protein with HEPN domain
MPSDAETARRSREALGHIRDNIRLAQGFCAGLDEAGFLADTRTLYAVIRCLEIISEASRRLLPEVRARHAGQPWAQIATAGNVYRHDYPGVREDVVWRTVHAALPPLLAAVEAELAAAPPQG